MNTRKLLMFFITALLTASVFVGSVSALTASTTAENKGTLENVRDYAAGTNEISYAVDGDSLFVGNALGWSRVETPKNVMVSAVAIDTTSNDVLYIGAANEMAFYRSNDAGENWTRFALSTDAIGMITEIAVDSVQNLVYIGTDTAGIFRLRDVGSSMTLSGQLLLDERVQEIVVDEAGTGMAFARTNNNLYRAENFGLRWVTVNTLNSLPTALAIVSGNDNSTAYVGTVDRGLLKSVDGGVTWTLANEGLNIAAGSRLQVSALAVDPAQPHLLYIASNYLYGSTTVHNTPSAVAVSQNGARTFSPISADLAVDGTVAKLLPVTNDTGAVYALTTTSRTPQALGSAPAMVATADVATTTSVASWLSVINTTVLAWIVAAAAALALFYAMLSDLRGTSKETASAHA